MDGLNLRTIKSKNVPQGFIVVSKAARTLNRSTQSLYVWAKSGALTTRQMLYWYDPVLKRNTLAFSEDVLDIYRNKARNSKEDIKAAKKGEADFYTELKEEAKEIRNENLSEDDYNIGDAKRVREVNKMKKEALELQKLENEVLLVDSIKKLMTEMGALIQQKLLSAIPRIASVTTACTDMHENIEVLQEEFEIILKDLLTPEDVINLCNKK